MEREKVLGLLKKLLKEKGKSLDYKQEAILKGTWNGEKLDEVASEINLSLGHVENASSELWKLLSEIFGKKVTKKNFRVVIQEFLEQKANGLAYDLNDSKTFDISKKAESELLRDVVDPLTERQKAEINIWEEKIKILETNKNEEIRSLKSRIQIQNERIQELENCIQTLETLIKSILDDKDVRNNSTLISVLLRFKEQLTDLNPTEELKLSARLKEWVEDQKESWIAEAGKLALEQCSSLTRPGGEAYSKEKVEEFYKNIRNYLNWITFCLSRNRGISLDKVHIVRAISNKRVYREVFEFIKKEKISELPVEESDLLKYYLIELIKFFS